MLDDVGHFLGVEPEIDGHEDAPVTAHTPEPGEEPGRVLRHHCDPFARTDPETVESGGLRTHQLREPRVRQRPPGLGRLVGLVDHADPAPVDELGALEEVVHRQRNLHDTSPPVSGLVADVWNPSLGPWACTAR